MTKHDPIPDRTEIIAQRGVADPLEIREGLDKLVAESGLLHYRLQDGAGHIHYLVQAKFLLSLIGWLSRYPRQTCHVFFAPPRKAKATDKNLRLAQLSDADILSVARIRLHDADLSIHAYDRTGPREHTARMPAQAPMRTINFDDMSASFVGYRIGKPTSLISRKPFQMTRVVDDPPVDLDPIDVVYTWVDSSDPKWQAKFSHFIGRPTKTTHGSELRYLSRDELRYSIRSVLKYAPWVRNIYIVTDDQRPDWFIGSDRIRIVDHREIFPDPSVLPVFNSHAIESCLHRIPGLSERFIYFNDDVFLGQPTSPNDFFSRGGRVMTYLSGHLSFNPEWIANGTLPTDAAFRNTSRIIERRFGVTPVAKAQHTPHPMLKSVLEMIEAEHPEGIAKTRSARLRSDSDMNVTGNLAYYYSLCLNRGAWPEQGAGTYRYVDTGRTAHMKTLHQLVSSPMKFFCLNLTHHQEVSQRRQVLMLRVLFYRLFPRRGAHERSIFRGFLHHATRWRRSAA